MQAGAILLLDGEKLKLRTQLGFPESAEPIFQAISLREGICGEAIKLGQPVWLDIEAYRDKASARLIALMEEQGVQTLFSAPILHKERALGAIALVAGEKCAFTPQETALLMSIGGQIGVAIENARLYEQARQEIERRKQVETELRRANQESDRRNRELTLLNRVITATTSDMEPQAILETVCRELVQAFGVAQSAAALLNEAKTELTVVSECRSEAHPSAMGVVIPVAENPASLYVLKQKKPLSLPDAQNDILLAPVREVMRQRGTVSLLLLPIVVHGEALGTIGVDATERREFSDEEIALAERVTAAVGQVLERAGN
jgi:GAF domain-containing protein